MIIRKIVMKNFRQYKDVSIKFSEDKEKNITVIYGNNTGGKTTLIKAFVWALYGTFDMQNPKDLLNYEVAREMEEGESKRVFVELEIQEIGKKYKFKRYRDYKKIDGKIKEMGPVETEIRTSTSDNLGWINLDKDDYKIKVEKMLPKNLSNFFFFDGERINALGQETKGRENTAAISKSIKQIIGLDTLINTIIYLKGKSIGGKSVLNSFNSDLEYDEENQKKIYELEENKRNYIKSIENINAKIMNNEKYIEDSEETFKRDSELLKGEPEGKKLESEIRKLENEIFKRKTSIDEDFKTVNKTLKDNILKLALDKISKQINKEFEKLEKTDSGITEMRVESIDEIIERGYCICGNLIEKGSKEYNSLMDERSKLPPVSYSTMINGFKTEFEYKSKVNKEEIKREIENIRANMLKCNNDIYHFEHQKEEKEERLKGIPKLKEVSDRYCATKLRREKYYNEIENYKIECEEYEQAYKEIEEELKKMSSQNRENDKIKKYIKFTQDICDELEKLYSEREKILREKIEKNMNQVFSEIYVGASERKIYISEDYKITLSYLNETYGSAESPESTGLGIMKAISFIEALVKTATDKINEKTSSDNMKEYPFVLDAPFSTLDSTHMQNVFKSLPKVADQVIIISMPKDIERYKAQPDNRIGKEYDMKKISEQHTEVEEVK